MKRFRWSRLLYLGLAAALVMAPVSFAKPRGNSGAIKAARSAERPAGRAALRQAAQAAPARRPPVQNAPQRTVSRPIPSRPAPSRSAPSPRAAPSRSAPSRPTVAVNDAPRRGPIRVTAPPAPGRLPPRQAGQSANVASRPNPMPTPGTIVSEVTRPRDMYPEGFGAPLPRFDAGAIGSPSSVNGRTERIGPAARRFGATGRDPAWVSRGGISSGVFDISSARRCYRSDPPFVSRPCYPRTRSCYVSYPRCYSNSLYYAWPSFGYWGGYTTYEPTVIVRETVPYYVEVPVSTESVVTGDYPATVIREAPVVEATPDSEATPPANAAILDEANRLFADGRYSEAREQYLRIVLADGNDGVAKLAYGLSSLALGEFQTAAAAVRGALAATPDLVGNPIDIRGFYREPETFERHVDSVRVHLIRTEADGLTDDAREAGLLLAFLFFASAQAELAETTLAELAGRNPGDSLIHSLLEAARNVLQTRTPAPAAPEPEVP